MGTPAAVDGQPPLVHELEGAGSGGDGDVGGAVGDRQLQHRPVRGEPRAPAVLRPGVGHVGVGGRVLPGPPHEHQLDGSRGVDGHVLQVGALAARPPVDERGDALPRAGPGRQAVEDGIPAAGAAVAVEEEQRTVGGEHERRVGDRRLLGPDHGSRGPLVDRSWLRGTHVAQRVGVHVAGDVHVSLGVDGYGVDVVGVGLGGDGQRVARYGAEVGYRPGPVGELAAAGEGSPVGIDPHRVLSVARGPQVVVDEGRRVPRRVEAEGLRQARDHGRVVAVPGKPGAGGAAIVEDEGDHAGDEHAGRHQSEHHAGGQAGPADPHPGPRFISPRRSARETASSSQSCRCSAGGSQPGAHPSHWMQR